MAGRDLKSGFTGRLSWWVPWRLQGPATGPPQRGIEEKVLPQPSPISQCENEGYSISASSSS